MFLQGTETTSCKPCDVPSSCRPRRAQPLPPPQSRQGIRVTSRSMMKTSRILGWLLLVGAVFATLAPIGLRPISDAPVSVERFGAYAMVSFLFALGYPNRRWQIVGGLIALAGAMEAMQNLELTRHGRFGDFVVKAAGCWFGVMVAVVLAFIPASMAKAEGRA